MTTAKKLDTFIIKDKFNFTSDELQREAQASAVRRAEVMGWTEVKVQPTGQPVRIDGDYKCYSFEIWGTEIGSTSVNDVVETKSEFAEKSLAAKEVNP